MPLDPPLAVLPVHTPATPAAPLAVRPVHSAATPAAPLASRPVAPLVAPVAAALTSGNIRWTAAIAGPEGNDITIAVAAAAAGQYATAFAVTGKALVVTPAGKQGMSITGTLVPSGSTGDLLDSYTDIHGNPAFSAGGVTIEDNTYSGPSIAYDTIGGHWILRPIVNGAGSLAHFVSNETIAAAPTPDLATWATRIGATGDPTVTAITASKAQVIAAAAASATASALVTAAASGDVTAAVATLTATHLTGGSGPAAPLPVQP